MTFRGGLVVVTLTGFLALSYEIVWFRICSFASSGSPATFGLLLAAYLGGLAGGARTTGRLCASARDTAEPGRVRLLGAFLVGATLTAYLVVPAVAWVTTLGAWGAALPLGSVAAGMLGATLPLISHLGIPADRLAGARLGRLYAANIAGSAAGSLVTGFVLLDVWPLPMVALGLGLLGLLVAAGLLAAARAALDLPVGAALLLVAGLLLVAHPWLFDRLYERLLYKHRWRQAPPFAHVIENRSGVITVSPSGVVFSDGAYDGVVSTDLLDDRNGIVRAYAVAAMHADVREILQIGLSTGAWAQVLAHLPGLERLTVIEINPGYLDLIPRYPAVASLLRNPKVEIVVDDGRRWLLRNPDRRFDVIVQNTPSFWRAHVTHILSVEHFALVKARLRPGGVFHVNTTGSYDALRTAFTMFPHGIRILNMATVGHTPVVLDGARWRRALERYRIDGRPALDLGQARGQARLEELVQWATSGHRARSDPLLASREEVLSSLPPEARLITDDSMASEWRFSLRSAFSGIAWSVE